jgi:hypothetical protein
MAKELLVFGEKTFKIVVPDDAKITFGPFSPPTAGGRDQWYQSGRATGTLRIYKGSKENIIGVFTGVHGFRDLSLEYAEEVAREEGATIWKSDEHGYMREDKRSGSREWIAVTPPALPPSGEDDNPEDLPF